MKKFLVLLVLGTFLLFELSFSPSPVRHGAGMEDSLERERLAFYNQVLAAEKDRETAPCDSVFKNIQIFGGDRSIKVIHLLDVMMYWGQSLGVSCTYCHNTLKWESDEKDKKQIARGMYDLRQTINQKLLTISNLRSPPDRLSSAVNCGTCHRGKPVPIE